MYIAYGELALKASNINVVECDVKNEGSISQLVSKVAPQVGFNFIINNAVIAYKHSLPTVMVIKLSWLIFHQL